MCFCNARNYVCLNRTTFAVRQSHLVSDPVALPSPASADPGAPDCASDSSAQRRQNHKEGDDVLVRTAARLFAKGEWRLGKWDRRSPTAVHRRGCLGSLLNIYRARLQRRPAAALREWWHADRCRGQLPHSVAANMPRARTYTFNSFST